MREQQDQEADLIKLKGLKNGPRFVPIEESQVREYLATFISLAILMLVSSVRLTLGTPPQSPIPLHIKAPWIFGGIQWLLLRFPVAIAGWIIPAASLGFVLTLPWWAGKAGVRWGRFGFMVLALFWSIITLAYFLEA